MGTVSIHSQGVKMRSIIRTIDCFVILLSPLLLCNADEMWEVTNHRGHYIFIFHDLHNLLLVQHGHYCYFTSVPEEIEKLWTPEQHRQELQNDILSVIYGNGYRHYFTSSLHHLREQHHDLLADHHCAGKH